MEVIWLFTASNDRDEDIWIFAGTVLTEQHCKVAQLKDNRISTKESLKLQLIIKNHKYYP